MCVWVFFVFFVIFDSPIARLLPYYPTHDALVFFLSFPFCSFSFFVILLYCMQCSVFSIFFRIVLLNVLWSVLLLQNVLWNVLLLIILFFPLVFFSFTGTVPAGFSRQRLGRRFRRWGR